MIKDFDKQMHDKAEGQTHVLILDGHSSHYMSELLEYAWDHNIMILGYPPTAPMLYKDLMLYALQEWRKNGNKSSLILRCCIRPKSQKQTS